jgi:hypothetical protein
MNFILVVLVAFFATYAYAGTIMKEGLNNTMTTSNCGGNCPGNDCPSCPCGTSKHSLNIEEWCAKYSWNQVRNIL